MAGVTQKALIGDVPPGPDIPDVGSLHVIDWRLREAWTAVGPCPLHELLAYTLWREATRSRAKSRRRQFTKRERRHATLGLLVLCRQHLSNRRIAEHVGYGSHTSVDRLAAKVSTPVVPPRPRKRPRLQVVPASLPVEPKKPLATIDEEVHMAAAATHSETLERIDHAEARLAELLLDIPRIVAERIDRHEARAAEALADIQRTLNCVSGRYDVFADELEDEDQAAA